MGRGLILGVLAGILVSGVVLTAVGLVVPVGDTVRMASAPQAESVEPAEAQVAAETAAEEEAAEVIAPEVAAETEASGETVTETVAGTTAAPEVAVEAEDEAAPETAEQEMATTEMSGADTVASEAVETDMTAPEAGATEMAAIDSGPETAEVEVPPGSEFARERPDETPVLPELAPAPAVSAAPDIAAPAPEAAPALADVAPAAIPEGQTVAPVTMASPDPTEPTIIAELPVADEATPTAGTESPIAPVLAGDEAPDPMPEIVTAAADALPEVAPETAPETTLPQVAEETSPATPDADVGAEAPEVPAMTEVAEAAPALPETPALPEPEAPSVEPAPAAEAPAPQPASEAPEVAEAPAQAPTVVELVPQRPLGNANAPKIGFTNAVPGVQINRLPQVGAASAEAGDAGGGVADAPASPELGADDAAVARFAAGFDNPDGLPLVGVILADDGNADATALAALGVPVTIALDPTQPGAASRARDYRFAGLEVAILAPPLPAGATGADLEVSYQGYEQTLPEAVALIGAPDAIHQTDRRMAQHLVALMGAEGLGLVTYGFGLDPAGQAATAAGLAHAKVFRNLDAAGEDAASIRRDLDRAAFEAARSGQVVVFATTAPDTVEALRGWIAEGAKQTAVAPVSAVMLAGG